MSADRVAIVSGGSKGLGRGIVAALLQDGVRVATFSRSSTPFIEECERAHPERFEWQAIDGADDERVRGFVKHVVGRFGRIDALINNAALAMEGVLPLAASADVHKVIGLNLEGTIHLTQAVTRTMLRQQAGSVVNITSIVGLRGYAGLAVYSSTKAAMDGLTRGLARELGPKGIRVNSIAPGFFETDLSASLSGPQRQQIVRRTPLGRLGQIEDIVGLLRFLLSPAASFITGQVLVIDGGITC